MDGISQQNSDGSWSPATPLPFTCEFGEARHNGFCERTDVKEYVRNENDKDGSSWDSEPICLCSEHSVNHQLYEKN